MKNCPQSSTTGVLKLNITNVGYERDYSQYLWIENLDVPKCVAGVISKFLHPHVIMNNFTSNLHVLCYVFIHVVFIYAFIYH